MAIFDALPRPLRRYLDEYGWNAEELIELMAKRSLSTDEALHILRKATAARSRVYQSELEKGFKDPDERA